MKINDINDINDINEKGGFFALLAMVKATPGLHQYIDERGGFFTLVAMVIITHITFFTLPCSLCYHFAITLQAITLPSFCLQNEKVNK